ncbi:hypothetical protein [Acinetobacter gerneri]|uniref:hypothetical protein n=1 Tax=Acinetobacter gerneri TaxID=202952 RepID=UPI0032120540
MTNKTSFSQTLGNLRHGTVLDEVDEMLTEALQATAETGKMSTITVKLTIKPNGSGVYKILDDVKSTLPKFDKEPTVLFTDGQKQLVREDPRQQKLQLEKIETSGPVDVKPLPATPKATLKTLS